MKRSYDDCFIHGAHVALLQLFILVAFFHVAVQARALEYAIELHSGGQEERVGLATVFRVDNSLSYNPITGKSLIGTLCTINSRLDGIDAADAELEVLLMTKEFFQSSLLDRIWQIYHPGKGKLERSVKIVEKYFAHEYTTDKVTFVKRKKKCWQCYKKDEVSKRTSHEKIPHLIADVAFKIVEEGIEKTAEQEWIINEAGYGESGPDVVSIDSHLRQQPPSRNNDCLDDMPSFERKRWDFPISVLLPFSHGWHSDNPFLESGNSMILGTDPNYFFPMDWQQAYVSQGELTEVSISISGDEIRIYEKEGPVLKKKKDPAILQRYDFVPSRGSMMLSIWGMPEEFMPWGWEYRDNAGLSRGIRYLRIDPVRYKQKVAVQTTDMPVGTRRREDLTFDPPSPPADNPVEQVADRAVIRGTFTETEVRNLMPSLIWIWLFSVRNGCEYAQHRDVLSF